MPFAPLPFDSATAALLLGLLYTLMPLTVWTILRGRHDPTTTLMWCSGAALSGISSVLLGARPVVPSILSYELGNAAGFAGYALRWAALRRECGAPIHGRALSALVLACSAAYAGLLQYSETPRIAFVLIVLISGSLAVAREARRLAQQGDSRSARMVSWAYGALGAALSLRLAGLLTGAGSPAPLGSSIDIVLVLISGILAALWGNIGYLGVAMEKAQRLESERRAELAAATARSEQAERQAQEMKALSDERQELLRVISHEVRQPLHNAQAVLQGVESAMQRAPADAQMAVGFTRARSVLQQITASLDNTLAVSTVLVGGSAPSQRDADVEMLVDLCMGDLPPSGRERVKVDYAADVRTAAMDIGLMRLAVRNLLNNALAYSTPGSEVMLRVADSDEPLALLIEVVDAGPPIDESLRPRLFERGTRGRHEPHGQGLGLYIVRQALRRQGGTVEAHCSGQGNRFVLTLPQGLEPG